MKIQKVSLDHIARLAGVHKATVSRALRNHPAIPLATRERIKEIARQQGYRPNPIVSMFQAQARASRPFRMQAAFAWISDYPHPESWRLYPWLRGYLDGALQRCEERGYRLEQIQISNEEGLDHTEEVGKIQKMLRSRGIFGVILPLLLHRQYVDQNWEDCTVAVIGNAHIGPTQGSKGLAARFYPQGFEIADRDIYYNMQLAVQNLLDLNYKRIGFVYSRYMDDEANGAAHSAFLLQQTNLEEENRVPILFLEKFKEGRPESFDQWFSTYKPDVVLCLNPVLRDWLVELGHRVPEDVGLANLNLVADVAGWAGINEHHEKIGAAAVDLLIGQLSRNEIGVPRSPRKIHVPGTWANGATLRMPRWQDSITTASRIIAPEPVIPSEPIPAPQSY